MIKFRYFFCSILLIALVGCGGGNTNTNPDEISDSSVIIYPNTDPRFSIQQQDGTIGVIKPAGENVFLNGSNIQTKTRLANFDHVSTGNDSAALLEFYKKAAHCDIFITDYEYGRVYGETKRCNHELETLHTISHASRGNSEYHAEVKANVSIISVISGSMIVRPVGNVSDVIQVNAGDEAVISRNRIEQIRDINDMQRLKQHEKFKFNTGKVKGKGIGTAGKAVLGIGAILLGREIYKRSKDNDDDDDGKGGHGTNNSDNQTHETPIERSDNDKNPKPRVNNNSSFKQLLEGFIKPSGPD